MLPEEEKKQLLHRLRRIEGQAGGLLRMVEADKYCIDIIQQIAAMQGALAQANKQLLDSHLRTCLVNAFSSKKAGERERMISEIVELFAKATRSGPAKRP